MPALRLVDLGEPTQCDHDVEPVTVAERTGHRDRPLQLVRLTAGTPAITFPHRSGRRPRGLREVRAQRHEPDVAGVRAKLEDYERGTCLGVPPVSDADPDDSITLGHSRDIHRGSLALRRTRTALRRLADIEKATNRHPAKRV